MLNLHDLFRKYKPSTILLCSFALVIFIGTILLSLPISKSSNDVSFVDALFTSVSATCVTGLITITPLYDLTFFGQIVVLLMIQIGGLGLMSFVAIIIMSASHKLDLSERKLLKDALNKDDEMDVSGYLKAIFKYTFITEIIGTFILASQLYNGTFYSLFQAFFLSVSAFCNAGIDICGSLSLLPYQGNAVVNVTVAFLIILGGLGFIVWEDLKNGIIDWYKNKTSFKFFVSRLKVHTKIVLIMNIVLILTGFILIYIFEYASLSSLPIVNQILVCFFNSVTLRTAGFYTIDYSLLCNATKVIMCLYMIVGASPGGTGGGFKTTTLFLMIHGIKCTLSNENIHVFKRHIHKTNYIKASAIISLYILVFFTGLILICNDTSLPFIDLTFEAASALGTVGLSAGVTRALSLSAKIVIMLMMFIGRVGPTTLLLSLQNKKDNSNIQYPKTDIIVG